MTIEDSNIWKCYLSKIESTGSFTLLFFSSFKKWCSPFHTSSLKRITVLDKLLFLSKLLGVDYGVWPFSTSHIAHQRIPREWHNYFTTRSTSSIACVFCFSWPEIALSLSQQRSSSERWLRCRGKAFVTCSSRFSVLTDDICANTNLGQFC